MKEEKQVQTIQRILVALDASPHSLAALEAAVELAGRFQAELVGLFVEDENLLRLGDLSFVQEVGLFSATRRRIDRQTLQRQIRIQSRHVQRVFTMTTQRAQITQSFRVVQGSVLSEVLMAASQADMLVLGKVGWSLLHRGQVGSTVRGILPKRIGMTLVIKEGTCLGNPSAVVYDGSPGGDRALFAAASLHRPSNDNRNLIVLLLAESPQAARTLQAQADRRLADRNMTPNYRLLTGATESQLADIIQQEGCGALVLPTQSSVLQNSLLVALLELVDIPVFLIR